MRLAYHQYSTVGKPLLVLHGLFGCHSNWGWQCTRLAARFAVFGVDLRNHGESPHAAAMSYPLMAGDVVELMDALGLTQCSLLGHSMGGKVAMQLALACPRRVARLIVVDMAPVEYPARNEAHMQLIAAMQALDLSSLKNRTEAEQRLAPQIPDAPTRKFILTNLVRVADGGFRWQLNLAAIREAYEVLRVKPDGAITDTSAARAGSATGAVVAANLSAPSAADGAAANPSAPSATDGAAAASQSTESAPTFQHPVLFIKGADSNYIRARNEPEIYAMFPQARIATIPAAGHWVHADQPQAVLEQVLAFLTAAD